MLLDWMGCSRRLDFFPILPFSEFFVDTKAACQAGFKTAKQKGLAEPEL